MLMTHLSPRFMMLFAATVLIAGCTVSSTTSQSQQSVMPSNSGYGPSTLDVSSDLTGPLLIAVNSKVGALEAYRIQPGGSNHARLLTKAGLFGYGNLVANGHVVVGLVPYPTPEVLVYDLDSHTSKTLPDPNGTPVDIAIGKDGSLYVINFAKSPPTNVTWYPRGNPNPKKLVCAVQNISDSIAVDNESNIFLNGYNSTTTGVVEIPNGPSGPEPGKCKQLQLQPENSDTGLAIDPKTEDLITLEDPGQCAGGEEGRMTIYPKPYSPNNYTWHDIGQNCTGGLRLNRDSTIVFTGDQDVSGSFTFVIQASFPGGRPMGSYHSGQPGGFTTIPNMLPN